MDKRISPVYRNKLDFVDENLGSEGYLLDVGCGAGHYFHIYKKKGLKYIGIEPNESLISENVIYASAEKMPFSNESFDYVVCTDVLEHVENLDDAIKEIKRVLKMKGKLILTVPNKKFPFVYDPINWILNKFGKRIPIGLWAWGHKRLFKEDDLRKLMEENGLKINHYEGRSRFLVALFVNYLPYLSTYVVSPLLKKIGLKKQGEFKVKEGIENSKLYRFYNKINELDKRKFTKGSFVNHCLVAEKV